MIITPNIAGSPIVLTKVLATVSIPSASWIDISSDGSKLFISSVDASYQQTFTVVSTATNTVLNTTNVGGSYVYYSDIYGLCANPARPNLFYFNGGRNNNAIYPVTVNTDNTCSVNGGVSNSNDNGYTPNDICVNKAGTRLYATRAISGANTVWVYDVSSGATISNVQSWISASGTLSNGYGDSIVVTPDGSKVFVANRWGNTLNMYNCNASGNIVSPYITAMPFSWVGYTLGMTMHPKGTEFMSWAPSWGRFARHSTSYAYASSTSAEGGRITPGIHSYCPNDAQYSIDGEMIYHTNTNTVYASKTNDTNALYDGSTPATWSVDSVAITGANRLVMGKDGTRAYVLGTNTLTVLGPK